MTMVQSTFYILSLLIWLPIIFGITFILFCRNQNSTIVRSLYVFIATLNFLIALNLIKNFNNKVHGYQFVEKMLWIDRFNVNYFLGIDGLSLWFIPLTTFITWIIVVMSLKVSDEYSTKYIGSFLVLSGLIIGAFSALDGMLFYVFFEATLIPIFIIIGVWGGKNRMYATFKLFLYTFFASLLMLITLLYLYIISGGSFEILIWHHLPLSLIEQKLIFLGFLITFAVKLPMWPVHTWLPDAHVEAPTSGSVILAAIMLKLGAYGFLRFSLPIAPDASKILAIYMIVLSLIAIIYIGLVTLVQKDIKKLVAYSSIMHMGFVTLGFFMFNDIALQGGISHMISHAFISTAMFVSIGILYDQTHTRCIALYNNIINKMPRFSVFFVVFIFANCGLPLTSGFVGEFMVILGAVKFNFWIGLLAATTLVLGAAYSLWLVKRVIFNIIILKSNPIHNLRDINQCEFSILGLLTIMIFILGLYPALMLTTIQTSVTDLLSHISLSKLN